MGCTVRDFVYEYGHLPPVRPVWMQQHQPIALESQGKQILIIMRPKTPEVYIATPTLTPNGSFIWANPEDKALAAFQQQDMHTFVQTALAKLQAQAADAATTTPCAIAAPPTAILVPSTSLKPSVATPTTPLVLRVSVSMISYSAKSQQKARAPDHLPDGRASKEIRRNSGKPVADQLPLPNCTQGKADTPPGTQILRSQVPSSAPASSTTVI